MKLKKYKRAIELQDKKDEYQGVLKRINDITNVQQASPISVSVRFDKSDRSVHINDSVLAEAILGEYVDKLNNQVFELINDFKKL